VAYDIGPRIGIEGEKEFKQAISAINKDMAVLGSELTKVSAQFGDNADSLDALKAKQDVYNKQVEEHKKKIEQLKQALENSAKEYGENDNKTKNWQISLNKAEAELAKTENALKNTTDKINNFGKESEQSGKEIEEAGKKAKSSGDDAEKGESGWSKLGSGLAKAGELAGKAVAALGTAAAAAGSALVGMSVSGAAYADDILTMSTQTGIATDELQKFKYASELIDVSTETLTKSMAKQIKSMQTAAKTSSEMGVDMDKLQKAQTALANKTLDVESAQIKYNAAVAKYGADSDVAKQAAIALEKAQNNLAQAEKEVEIASKPVKGAMNDMSIAYEKLGVKVTNADGSLRDGQDVYWEVIDALGKMENETERDAIAMQLLGKSAQELNPLIEAGSARLKELGAEAEAAGYVLSEDTLNAFGAFDDQLQYLKVGAEAAKNALGTLLLPALTTLAGDGVDLLGQFTNGINNANGDIGKMVDVVADTLNNVVAKIIEYLPQLIDTGMQIIGTLGQGLLDNLPMIIDSAVEIITSLTMGLLEALPKLVDGALQIIIALASGITQFLPELIPAIVDTVLMIAETLIDNVDMLIDASIEIILALAEGLIDALPKLIDKIPVIIEKLITAIVNNLPKLIEAGIQLIIALAGGLIKAIPQLISKIPEIITSLVNGFSESLSTITDIGKNIVSGIWEGILSMGKWLGDQISGFFSGIVDGAKDFLGIHSPSTVFAGIGENMALGLGEGFGKTFDGVAKKINNKIPKSFDINGNYNGGGYAPTTTQNINVFTTLDGKIVAKSTSRIQAQVNRSKSRALGVVPVW
jgi:hypothetical protein